MKIGPFHIGRHVTAAAESPKRPTREAGASGTILHRGILEPTEYNNDLRGANALKVYDRMLRSDGAVQEAVEHIFAPLKGATWDIEAASDDPLDVEIAEATRRAFFDWLRQPWVEYLDQLLEYVAVGHQVFEYAWQVVDDELEFPDPTGAREPDTADPLKQRTKPRMLAGSVDQFLTFKRFSQRLPETIEEWHAEDGELTHIVQRTWDGENFRTITIDAQDLIVATHKRRGDEFTGRGILRAAYKPWVFKELIEKVAAMAVEKHGVGVIVAYPPASSANDQATIDRLEEIVKDIRAGESVYIVAPGPKAQANQQGAEGWTFEIIAPPGRIPDFTPLLEYHRAEIKGALLVRFSELGHGQTGARATSSDQSQVWYDALHTVAEYVAAVHAKPIERFVRANYATATRFPKLVARDIDSKNLQEFAESHARLVTSGAVKVDRSYRKFVRETIGAPEEDNPDEEPELEEDDGLEDEKTKDDDPPKP